MFCFQPRSFVSCTSTLNPTSILRSQVRFLRLVLDEGGASTGKTERSRHALMTQAIHSDSKVLVDATPYEQGRSRKAKLKRLRQLGATRAFFSGTRSYEQLEKQWDRRVVNAKEGTEVAEQIVRKVTNWLLRPPNSFYCFAGLHLGLTTSLIRFFF